MKVVDFIVQDAQRARHRVRFGFFCLGLVAIALGLGWGTRADFVDALSSGNLGPSLFLLMGIGALLVLYRSRLRARYAWMTVSVVLCLGVSLLQPQTSISLAKFADPARFWPENLHCLGLGTCGGLLGTLLVNFFVDRWLPALGRRGRGVFSVAVGLMVLSLLAFHCMGAYTSHILIAHWGAGILTAAVAYFSQSWIMGQRMARLLASERHVRRMDRL